jgi:hypothetical protein
MKQHLFAVLLAASLAGPVLAETMTIQEALSGKTLPLALKLKDLDETWRRVDVGGAADAASPTAIYRAMLSGQTSGGAFFTKGQTITIGTELYLVGYTIQSKPADMAKLQMMMRSGQPPEAEKPTAQTPLALSLTNMRSINSLSEIKAFNLEAELTGADTAGSDDDKHAKESNEASAKNLGKLSAAVTTYVNERKVLPLLNDVRTAEQELILYAGNKEVFLQPSTKKPYRPNPAVAGRKPAEFDKPDKVVLFYEAAPAGDGTRGVLFLDGHIDRLIEQQWKKLKDTAKLP